MTLPRVECFGDDHTKIKDMADKQRTSIKWIVNSLVANYGKVKELEEKIKKLEVDLRGCSDALSYGG